MTISYEEYGKGTDSIIETSKMDALMKETGKYYCEVLGKKFVVYPNVFSPKYFNDTKFFAKMLDVNEREEFLEIGPGTGAISVLMALKGAKVTASDINPDAVKNTKENAELHKVSIEVYKGNVYDSLPKEKKFNTIFWNTPFNILGDKNISLLQKSVKDPRYIATKKFVMEAKDWLKPEGRLLIGFSDVLGKPDLLMKFVKEAGFVVYDKKTVEEMEANPVTFDLYFCKRETL